MAIEVLLPKLGLTMQEGVIEEWLVPTGHEVRVGEPILRLATDKVDVEVEAEAAGRLHPVAAAGATLPPGALIGWLLAEGEAVPASATGAPGSATEAEQPRLLASPNARRVAREVEVAIESVSGTGPGGRIVSEDVLAATANRRGPVAKADPSVVSPLVRKLARDAGVDLTTVNGSGPGGRIRREDVHASGTAAASAPARTSVNTVPLTGMRGAIARRMHSSLHEMAQLTHGFEVSMDAVVALRAQLKDEWGPAGLPVPSLGDFVVHAAARSLLDHPRLNAFVDADAIHLYEAIHVGIAVAVPDGLLVPVVTDAAARSLVDLSTQTRALATAAREGRLALAQLEGATFVVTSLGGYGVDFFTPIVNPGNVAILGVGRLRDGVRWEGETPRRTQVLTLSLTFDHRAVDGAPAAEYLLSVAAALEQPLRLLAR